MDAIAAVRGPSLVEFAPNTKTRTSKTQFQQALNEAAKDYDNDKNDKKLKEACQELESVLVYQMIRAMRSTVPKGGLIDEGFGGEVFESMLDEEFARQMAKTGSTGLADLILRQLTICRKSR